MPIVVCHPQLWRNAPSGGGMPGGPCPLPAASRGTAPLGGVGGGICDVL